MSEPASTPANKEAEKRNDTVQGKTLVRIGLAVMAVFLVAICGAFMFCGKKSFVTATELAEAHTLLDGLGKGLVACAKDEGLPVTTSQVPARLSELSGGKTYQPKEHDYDDPGFACAQFHNMAPQHFQIQWERMRPDHGRVHAYADLDGNGQVDVVVYAMITCDPNDLRQCTMGQITP
ncbi:MAG TPA: hypothetical protein VF407_07465 [Polyangiaceae bacterium]